MVVENESLPLVQVIETLGQTEWRKASSSEVVVKELGSGWCGSRMISSGGGIQIYKN